MRKKSHKEVKFTAEEMAYELPAEIDIKRLRPVARGPEATQKFLAQSKRLAGLDPELARDFPTVQDVNEALRKYREIQRMVQPTKRRKSA